MICRILSLDPIFTKNKTFKNFTIFFNYANILPSMAFTENLGLSDYAGFSQITITENNFKATKAINWFKF